MTQVYLFELASQRTQWLSARQSLIAGNVANANTPGFRALDLPPFSSVLERTEAKMATTNPAHIAPTPADFAPARPAEGDGADATLSGNSVNLQDEMIKLGEVSREYSMANSVKKIFHQMLLATLK